MAKNKSPKNGIFGRRPDAELKALLQPVTHVYHGGARCETDSIGFPTPNNRSPLELVVDASQGFIPLWDRQVTLRWRFQEQSLLPFADPEAVKQYIRQLLGKALYAWGEAVPVKFTEQREPWDFEVVVRSEDNCNVTGCTLARAFFPDAGQHELVLFPKMFGQSAQEQMETMAHELGHVFGLRHFFAQVSEKAFPSRIFGQHRKISIMNYGANSKLTKTDISDLKQLYADAWSGQLMEINGTPVQLMTPYSHLHASAPSTSFFSLAPAARGMPASLA